MKHLKRYWVFWISYAVFAAVLGTMILCSEKAGLHLRLNSVHTPALDLFFRLTTEIGSWVPFAVAAGLLFYRFRAALLLVAAQIAAGTLGPIFKRTLNMPRPKRFFADNFPDIELPAVAGVTLHSSHSFPSGHTASAFALFLVLTLLTKRRELHFLYFLLAALTGYSRIYLSQHFALDVLAGSLVGIAMTIVTLYFIDKKNPQWYGGSIKIFNKRT